MALVKAITKEKSGMILIKDLIIFLKSIPGKFDSEEVVLSIV